MKIEEIMTSDVRTIEVGENLASAVELMWEIDCGSIPIVESNGSLVGIVTDRDIAIACGTRNLSPSQVHAFEFCHDEVETVSFGTSVAKALKRMAKTGLRRLPVLDEDGNLVGIFSISDAFNFKLKGKEKVLRDKAMARLSSPRRDYGI